MIEWHREGGSDGRLNTFDHPLVRDNLHVFHTADVMFQWDAVFIVNQTWKVMCVALKETRIDGHQRSVADRAHDTNLPNGMEPWCCARTKCTLLEKIASGIRTNGKSKVELTTKFDGQWRIQYGRSNRSWKQRSQEIISSVPVGAKTYWQCIASNGASKGG